jgi:hypothetical protein
MQEKPVWRSCWMRGETRSAVLRTSLLSAWLGSLCLSAPTADAANRRSFLFGGEAATTGASLIARARGTDALFYNPAGLVRTSSSSINLSLSAFTLRTASIERGFVVEAGERVFSEDLSLSEFLPTPSALVYARKLSPRWGYGFGIFVVQSSDTRLSARVNETNLVVDGLSDPVGLASGLDQNGSSTTYNIGGGLAWQASPRLRLGASLFAVYDRTVAFAQVFSSLATEGARASYLLNASEDIKNAGFQGALSLQWEVMPTWTLSLLARGPVVSLYTWGDIESVVAAPDEQGQLFASDVDEISEFNVQIVESAAVELMTVFDLGPWRLGGTIEVSPPIEQGGLLPRSIDAIINFRVGAQHRWTERTKLGFGFFTDLAPSDRLDQVLGQRVDYYAWTVGFETARALNPSRTILFTTAFGITYAVGFGEVGAASLDGFGEVTSVTVVPRSATFHEAALNLASGIEF